MKSTDEAATDGLVELKIDKWVQNGLTLSHHNGNTIFVHGALPGETVQAEIVKMRAQHSFAVVRKVLLPASNRVESDCLVFPACGGCSFRHISYEEELGLKLSLLQEHKFLAPYLSDLKVHSGPRNEYRNQVRLHEQNGRRGFFALHTNDVVSLPADGCRNLSPALNKMIGSRPDLEFNDRLTADSDANKDARSISLPDVDFSWRMPAQGFAQSNRFLFSSWLKTLSDMALRVRNDLPGSDLDAVYEFFCGTGLIGAAILLRRAQKTGIKEAIFYGAESHGPAIEKGKSNFRAAGLKARFRSTDLYRANVAEYLSQQFPAPGKDSLLIANPPRAGLKDKLCQWIQRSASQFLIYSSCNPQTLNRDLGILQQGGFQIAELHCFDFFPGTPHSELVTLLRRA